jgi:hypothetical protein
MKIERSRTLPRENPLVPPARDVADFSFNAFLSMPHDSADSVLSMRSLCLGVILIDV